MSREPTVARGRLFASLLAAILALGVAFGGAYDVLQHVTTLSRVAASDCARVKRLSSRARAIR